jgi:hypothetical protein
MSGSMFINTKLFSCENLKDLKRKIKLQSPESPPPCGPFSDPSILHVIRLLVNKTQ